MEDLIAEINERGWTVYQLCQDRTWRAYLRQSSRIAYGEGPTPSTALQMALDAKTFESAPMCDLATSMLDVPTSNLEDALANLRCALGLASTPINRRSL